MRTSDVVLLTQLRLLLSAGAVDKQRDRRYAFAVPVGERCLGVRCRAGVAVGGLIFGHAHAEGERSGIGASHDAPPEPLFELLLTDEVRGEIEDQVHDGVFVGLV